MSQKIDDFFWELRANSDKLAGDLKKAEEHFRKYGATVKSRIEDAIDKIMQQRSDLRMTFSFAISTRSVSQLEALQQRLKKEFEKKIAVGADANSLELTRIKISAVENALSGVQKATKTTTKDFASWAMIATGVNQSFEMLRSSFHGLKETIGESVKKSLELEVMRSEFEGTEKDLENFRRATGETVSTGNLIRLSNQATDLGLSLENQAIFFALAKDASEKYGVSVEEGMNKIILATEGNVRGLKMLGIQKAEYQNAVKDGARLYGTQISNLDGETQKQIRLEAVLRLSKKTLEEATNRQKSNADKLEQLSVKVERAKVEFGGLVAKGLMPLLNAFDKASGGTKAFISTIIGVTPVVLNLIPVISQLILAKTMLATHASATATAITAESTALATNTGALATNAVAVKSWFAKAGVLMSAGFFASLGIAIGVGAGELIDYIKFTLPEEINKASEEASTKLKAEQFGDGLKRVLAGQRRVGLGGNQQEDFVQVNIVPKLSGGEVKQIQDRIRELTQSVDVEIHPEVNLKAYQDAQKEINDLNKKLAGDTEAENEKKRKSEEASKKRIELLKQFTTNASLISQKYFDAEVARLKKETQDFISAGADKVTAHRLLQKQIEALTLARIRAEIDAEKEAMTEANNNYRIALNDRKTTLEKYVDARKPKKTEDEPFAYMTPVESVEKPPIYTDKQANKILEDYQEKLRDVQSLASGIGDSFASAFDFIKITAKSSENILENVFVNMANSFIAQVQRMIAEWITFKALTWLGGLLLAPATAGASLATPAMFKSGGVFQNGRKVQNYASGGNFIVPSGYEGDRFPMLVSSGERVSVTPSGQVGGQEKLLAEIRNAIHANTMTLATKNLSVTVENRAPSVVSQVIQNKKIEKTLSQQKLNLNES